ncbi:translation initiation factor IF-2 [Equus przewalskii]|uniref:Translation initiation factor IF-2 n=1 Tax=Equus przewalskii TaxID=9798 RepID=A0ABM4MLM3_EQUPR
MPGRVTSAASRRRRRVRISHPAPPAAERSRTQRSGRCACGPASPPAVGPGAPPGPRVTVDAAGAWGAAAGRGGEGGGTLRAPAAAHLPLGHRGGGPGACRVPAGRRAPRAFAKLGCLAAAAPPAARSAGTRGGGGGRTGWNRIGSPPPPPPASPGRRLPLLAGRAAPRPRPLAEGSTPPRPSPGIDPVLADP